MPEQRIQLQPELTGIALAYRNENCIADKVLPKVQVGKLSFQYRKFDKGTFLTLEDTKVGEKGMPQRIETKARLITDTLDEHALEDVIAVSRKNEIEKDSLNSSEILTAQLTDCLKLRREVELANIMTNTANYEGNFKSLSSSEKISSSSSDAAKIIMSAMDAVLKKPNKMVLSRRAFTALRQNPSILAGVNKNSSTQGVASLEGIKDLFDLDEILIGESVANTSKKKDALNIQACWQNDIVLLHVDKNATNKYGVSFGYNAFKDDITIMSYFDGRIGSQGAEVYKAYMSEKYIISCPECGYLLKDVI